MKKFVTALAVAFAGLLTTVGIAPSAHAYPEVIIDLSVDRQVLYGGENFTATGTSNVDCAWNLEWNGVVRTGEGSNGSPFSTTYTAPDVTKVTKIPLHGTCTYTEPTERVAGRVAAAGAVWERTIIITVLPEGSGTNPPDDGTLPGTGGPNKAFLFGGVILLLAGASAVVVARRRAEDVDMITGQA